MGLNVNGVDGLAQQEELFFTIERLKALANTRAIDTFDTMDEKPPLLECLCGREIQKDKEHYIPIYVETLKERMVFSVCPKCNPAESCVRCEGKGHLIRQSPHGLEELTSCDCIQTRVITDHLNRAKIPRRYLTAHLKAPVNRSLSSMGFDLNTISHFEQAQHHVSSFCENAALSLRNKSEKLYSKLYSSTKPIHLDKPFLVLMGGIGTGKTYLACAALKHLITSSYTGIICDEDRDPLALYNVTGRFVDFPSLLMEIRDSISNRTSDLSLLAPLMEVDVLVLDEFGKGRPDNAWQLEKLDDVINARYNNNRITILTTNYLLSAQDYFPKNSNSNDNYSTEFEDFWKTSLSQRIGLRMFDRLLECSQFVSFVGLPSIRRQQAELRLRGATQSSLNHQGGISSYKKT